MRRRAVVSLTLSCLLAGCAHQEPDAMPGMAWSLHHAEGEGDKLAFGQPQSDNVLLMLTCQPRSGDVRLSLSAAPEAKPVIDLASRGVRGRFAGETAPSVGGAALIEARTSPANPALTRFARTGELTVMENGRRTTLPAGEAKGDIGRFFERCGGA